MSVNTFATISAKPVKLHLAIVHGPSIRCPRGGASILAASSDRKRVRATAKSFNSNESRGRLKASIVSVEVALGATRPNSINVSGKRQLQPMT